MSAVTVIGSSVERRVVVRTGDGVELAVREYGPRDAEVTVVFLHGHCMRAESWNDVRDELLRQFRGARVVCYDHRGHGDSAIAPRHTYNLARLGSDLGEVIDAVAPAGPVVLVGHSMGGMTVLTYVSQRPWEIGDRIVGVALVATGASGIAEAGFGRLIRHPVVSTFQTAVRCAPRLMRHAKALACKVFAPLITMAEFGDRKVSPRIRSLVNAMHNQTSIVAMAAFLSAFLDYDRTDALPTLSGVPTLILCGSADLMTPPSHSIAMAAAVDYADLALIEGAGHSVILEQPELVTAALTRLLTRAATVRTGRGHLAAAA
ncbi:alpha/beta fold hydrolase [Nocardia sp. NPDC058058]|uniref:alpha/beta fold hydrolase n=1 Tax=Nocardia sp. NPDC058058 TaxID=3346317 RepID=UPI0036D7B54D